MKRIALTTCLIAAAWCGTATYSQDQDVPSLIRRLQDKDLSRRAQAAEVLGKFGPRGAAAIPALIGAVNDPDLAVRHEALLALERIGPAAKDAVPTLIAATASEDQLVRHGAIHALGAIGPAADAASPMLLRAMDDDDVVISVAAAWAFARIFPEDDGNLRMRVVPTLIEALNCRDEHTCGEAVPALGDVGPPAIPTLIGLLTNTDAPIRVRACNALAEMGPQAAPAVTVLIGRLGDSDRQVRWHAARALGEIGEAAKEAVPALTEAVRKETGINRAHAATALGQIGPNGWNAIPTLAEALDDRDPAVRRSVAWAMARLGPQNTLAIPMFVRLLRDPDPTVVAHAARSLAEIGPPAVSALTEALHEARTRYWAVLILSEIGPEAEAAVPALLEAMQQSEAEERRATLVCLGAIGPGGKAACEAIVRTLLRDQNVAVRASAAYALGRIGSASDDVIPALKQSLQDEDAFTRLVSAWSLVEMNLRDEQFARLVVPLLIELLKHEQPALRTMAAETLGHLGPLAAPAVAALVERLKDTDAAVRGEALGALGDIGAAAKTATRAIIGSFEDPDEIVRQIAAEALGKMGPDAAVAAPALKRLVEGTNESLRLAGACALTRIRSGDEEVAKMSVPVLTPALDIDHPAVRRHAAEALGNLGTHARSAVPALRKALEDDDALVRRAAREALRKIGDEPTRGETNGNIPERRTAQSLHIPAVVVSSIVVARTFPSEPQVVVTSPYYPPQNYWYYRYRDDPYWYYRYGDYASTSKESHARGMAALIEAQGRYNLLTARAAAHAEEARRLHIENHLKATQTYFDMRRANEAYQAEQKAQQESRRSKRFAETAKLPPQPKKPTRLTASQLDPATGKITWPEALKTEDFAKFRDNLDTLFKQRAESGGEFGPESQFKVEQVTTAMLEELRKHIRDLRTVDYLAAHKFINALADEARVINQQRT
jgi:HEAT repeat protein